jgi:LysM repeat protein
MVLYLIGILLALAIAAMLWQQRKSSNNWQRQFTFFVDLLALSATALVVGVLAMVQLATPINPAAPSDGTMSTPADATIEPLPEIVVEPTFVESDTLPIEPSPTITATVEVSPTDVVVEETPTLSATSFVNPTTTVTATLAATATVKATAEGTLTPEPTAEATPTVRGTVRAVTPTRTPVPSATPRPSATPEPTATLPPTETPLPTPTSANRTYTVESGDTLLAIALQFDVSVAAIIAANPGINAESLSIGQELIIPPAGTAPPASQATPVPTTTTYTVQAGDTFGSIAADLGTTSAELQRLNPNVDPTRLRIGQVIVVPR